MKKNIKNILMFVTIGLVLVLVYVFFIKKDQPEESLSSVNNIVPNVEINTVEENTILDSEASKIVIATLSNIKNISLDDLIFSSYAFQSLRDGTINLVQDGKEGRKNPFAPIGVDDFSSNDFNSLQAPLLDLGQEATDELLNEVPDEIFEDLSNQLSNELSSETKNEVNNN